MSERTERFQCTADHPWRPGLPTPVTHPDACEVGEQEDGWPAGDIVTYACPHCGHRWKVELPQ
jgi:hypothetical protein